MALPLSTRMSLEGCIDVALDRMRVVYRKNTLKLADAREGLEAFLEKRPPVWQDR
jgi:enoyl-CoA hydratase/carnithine racemase